MDKFESLFFDGELRVDDGEKPKITGYAAIFNSLSNDLGGFREQILPGAFRDVLSANGEILALMNHDPRQVVARRSTGTLSLREDPKGLYVEVTPPNTTIGRDLVENIRVGNIRGMSFHFNKPTDTWERRSGDRIRTISRVGEVREVTFTAIPCYTETTAQVRSMLDKFDAEDKATPRRDAAYRRLRIIDALSK